MKKYLPSRCFTIAAIVSSLVIAGLASGPPSLRSETGAASSEKKLYRKMGVLPIPHIAEAIDFTLKDLDGRPRRLSEFRGKIVFLNFWTSWCPDCRIEMPSMQKLHTRLKDKDFVMIAVDFQESAEVVQNFFKRHHLTFAALLDSDGRIGAQMSIRSIPTTFILSRNGKIAGTVIGAREWDSKASFALFDYLIHLKDVTSSYQ